jgi:hypothetical protein
VKSKEKKGRAKKINRKVEEKAINFLKHDLCAQLKILYILSVLLFFSYPANPFVSCCKLEAK